MKVIRGDLLALALAGEFDVIIHGCNCYCTMGAGIALSIKRLFPEAFAADKQTKSGDRKKLGTITSADIERGSTRFTIVNGYTQFDFGGRGTRADYDAIRSVMNTVATQFPGKRIGYPKIGAGLAKGDWSIISAIIDEELAGQDHTLVEFAG